MTSKHLPSFLLLLVTIVWITGCKHSDGNKFTVVGAITNMPEQHVVLEQLGMGDVMITVIDSTTTDNKGHFELSGNATELSLFRVRFEQNKFIMLAVDKGTVKVTADWTALEQYNVTGSAPSSSLRDLMSMIRATMNDANTLGMVIDSIQARGNDSLLTRAKTQRLNLEIQFTQHLERYADTTAYAPNAVFAASILNIRSEKDYLNAFTQSLNRRFPNSKLAKDFINNYTQAINKLEHPNVQSSQPGEGTMAPEIDLPTPDDKNVKLSSLRGKYVLLDFWASWCGPCRAENPNVVAAYDKFKDKNFTIYSVSLDNNKDKWLQAIADDGLAWTNVSDLKGWESIAARTYNVESIPGNFLIDPNGKIIATNLRGDELEEKLEEVLK